MSSERKFDRDLVVRSGRGSEFQIVGAAKEKDLRPMALFMLGTTSRLALDDLRVRGGVYGRSKSRR